MMIWINRRWAVGLALFAFTLASYAQWSNPADDVPAYHPSAPLKVSALPPILAGARLTGENFRFPWQVHVYQQAIKVGNVLYQLPGPPSPSMPTRASIWRSNRVPVPEWYWRRMGRCSTSQLARLAPWRFASMYTVAEMGASRFRRDRLRQGGMPGCGHP